MNTLTINNLRNLGGIFHVLFLIIYFSIGVFALLIVGIIEYDFLRGIFSAEKYREWCLWAVIVFESFKGFAIYFHRYVEYYADFGFTIEKRLKRYLKLGRYIAFIVSFVVGVAKVSEYLDSPRFNEVWTIEKADIENSYSQKKIVLINERDSLTKKIEDYNKSRDKQIKKNINRLVYIDPSKYNPEDIEKKAQVIEEANKLQVKSFSNILGAEQKRIDNLNNMIYNWNEIVKDSLRANKSRLSKEYWKTENPTVVGVFRLTEELSKKVKTKIHFKEFKYLYVLLISFLVSALLELVIMNSINYSSYVFFDRLDPKEIDARQKKR